MTKLTMGYTIIGQFCFEWNVWLTLLPRVTPVCDWKIEPANNDTVYVVPKKHLFTISINSEAN